MIVIDGKTLRRSHNQREGRVVKPVNIKVIADDKHPNEDELEYGEKMIQGGFFLKLIL